MNLYTSPCRCGQFIEESHGSPPSYGFVGGCTISLWTIVQYTAVHSQQIPRRFLAGILKEVPSARPAVTSRCPPSIRLLFRRNVRRYNTLTRPSLRQRLSLRSLSPSLPAPTNDHERQEVALILAVGKCCGCHTPDDSDESLRDLPNNLRLRRNRKWQRLLTRNTTATYFTPPYSPSKSVISGDAARSSRQDSGVRPLSSLALTSAPCSSSRRANSSCCV